LPKFENILGLNLTKKGVKRIGVTQAIANLPKNILIEKNTDPKTFTRKIWIDIRTNILNAICYDCSGLSKDGRPLFKFYSTFAELVGHARLHDGSIPAYSMINLSLEPNRWVAKSASTSPKTIYLTEREILHCVNSKFNGALSGNSDNDLCYKGGGGEVPMSTEYSIETEPDRKPNFTIYGWNARSAYTPENSYLLGEFLIRKN
jgi:hypothetical protein